PTGGAVPEHGHKVDVGMRREQGDALHADVTGGAGDGGAETLGGSHAPQCISILHIYAEPRSASGASGGRARAAGRGGAAARGLLQYVHAERAGAGALDVDGGADQRKVREGLREVAEQLPRAGVHLLGIQLQRGGEGEAESSPTPPRPPAGPPGGGAG